MIVGIRHGFLVGFLLLFGNDNSRLAGFFPGLFLALFRRSPQTPHQGEGAGVLLLVAARQLVVFLVFVVSFLFPDKGLGTVGPDFLCRLVNIKKFYCIFVAPFFFPAVLTAGAFLGLGGNRKGRRAFYHLDLSFCLFRRFVLLWGFVFLCHARTSLWVMRLYKIAFVANEEMR